VQKALATSDESSGRGNGQERIWAGRGEVGGMFRVDEEENNYPVAWGMREIIRKRREPRVPGG